jgi:NAD(P)-dependent dehydrogenase (short-subunit alcohol dehydrogenase family)
MEDRALAFLAGARSPRSRHSLKEAVMRRLEGRVAIVTGAAMGNGKGGAEALARHGAHVVLCDISDELKTTEKEFLDKGYAVSAAKFDVRDKASVQEAIDDVVAKHGRIDILFNNAGVAKAMTFLEMTDELRDFHIDVNVKGVWNVAKAVYPVMVKAKYGRIVNMSSVTGPMVADGGETAYALSKAAIWGFTKALAFEAAAYGITVNAVCPGYIMTPMAESLAKDSNPDDPSAALNGIAAAVPLGRLGRIGEVGDLVVFLASDESSYITGTQIVIDGGSTLPETFGAIGV